jgi:hypothetical protein
MIDGPESGAAQDIYKHILGTHVSSHVDDSSLAVGSSPSLAVDTDSSLVRYIPDQSFIDSGSQFGQFGQFQDIQSRPKTPANQHTIMSLNRDTSSAARSSRDGSAAVDQLRALQYATGLKPSVSSPFFGVTTPPTSRTVDGLDLNTYHTMTRLGGNREGLLVDPGAHSNLTGDEWVKRMTAKSKPYGYEVKYHALEKPQSVQGVGQGSQTAACEAIVPIAMADGQIGAFKAAVVGPGSLVPA